VTVLPRNPLPRSEDISPVAPEEAADSLTRTELRFQPNPLPQPRHDSDLLLQVASPTPHRPYTLAESGALESERL